MSISPEMENAFIVFSTHHATSPGTWAEKFIVSFLHLFTTFFPTVLENLDFIFHFSADTLHLSYVAGSAHLGAQSPSSLNARLRHNKRGKPTFGLYGENAEMILGHVNFQYEIVQVIEGSFFGTSGP